MMRESHLTESLVESDKEWDIVQFLILLLVNPFNASCSKLLLVEGSSGILVYPLFLIFECQSARMSEMKNSGLDQHGKV